MAEGSATGRQWPFYYAGSVIVLAMVLGGGSRQGLGSDHIIEIAMLPALFLGLGGLSATRTGAATRALVSAIILLLVLQFFPVFRASPSPDIIPEAQGWAVWSRTPLQSLESALFAICVLGFALLVTRFSDREQERLLRFVFVGFFIHLIAGFIQLSYGREPIVSDLLAFTIRSGIFANENHFASLVFCMLPLIAWYFLARGRRFVPYLLVSAMLVFFLFAVGSRAGMAISAILSVFCLFWFGTSKLSLTTKVVLAGVMVAIMVGAGFLIGSQTGLEDDLRVTIAATTWQAIQDYWLTGSGLGSFTTVYPQYEPTSDVFSKFINQAHNDHLEIFLEAGVAGVALVAGFMILICINGFRSRLSEAALIALLALALHSTVDYPVRTFTIAVVFAYFCGIIFSSRPYMNGGHRGDSAEAPVKTRSQRQKYHEDFVALERADVAGPAQNPAMDPSAKQLR